MSDYVAVDQDEDKDDYENFGEFSTRGGDEEDYVIPVEPGPPPLPVGGHGVRVSRHQSTVSTYSTSSGSSGFPSGGSLTNDDISSINGGRNRLTAFRPKSPAPAPQPLNLARNRNNRPETRIKHEEQFSDIDEGCYDVIPGDYVNMTDDDDDGLAQPKVKPLPPTPPAAGQAGRAKVLAFTDIDQNEILKSKSGLRPTPAKAPPKTFNTDANNNDEGASVTSARAQFGGQNKLNRHSSFMAAHTPVGQLHHSQSDPKFPFQSNTPPGTVSSATKFKLAPPQTKQPHPGQSGPPPVAQKSRTLSEPAVPSMNSLQSTPRPTFASVSDSTTSPTGKGNFVPTGVKFPGKSTASPTASTPPWKATSPATLGGATPTPIPQATPPFPAGNKFTPKVPSANPASSSAVPMPPSTAAKFPSAQQTTTPPWKKTADEKAAVPQPATQSAVPAWKKKEVVPTPPALPPSTSTPSKWNTNAGGGSVTSSTGNKFANGSSASPIAAAAVPKAPGNVSIPITWKKSNTTPSSDSGEVYYNDGQPETPPPPPRPDKASSPWSRMPNKFNQPEATPLKVAPVPKFSHSSGKQPSRDVGDGLTYQELPAEPAPPVPSVLGSKVKQFEGSKGNGRTFAPVGKIQGQRYDPVILSSSGQPKIVTGPSFGRGAEMVSCEYEELPENSDPLVMHSWYFGDISRSESESTVLRTGKDGTYLVRKRQVEGGDAAEPYCISVVRNRQVHHVIIRQRPDKLWAIGSKKTDEKKFPDIPQLISFYGCNEIELSVGTRIQLLQCPPRGRF